MNYGLYLSASGVLNHLHRQDVLANNLANVETVGFKPDLVFNRARLPERLASGATTDPKLMLEQLGGGLVPERTYTSRKQGTLQHTGNPLDTALVGDGFFTVTGDDGVTRLTRDGRFTRSAAGELVMSGNGLRVLDDRGRPIQLAAGGTVQIDPAGRVVQGGREIARIQLVEARPDELTKTGENLFRYTEADATPRPADGVRVEQHHVEGSAVDPIMTLHKLVGATKTAQASAKLMQYHDFIMGEAIGTFGRIA